MLMISRFSHAEVLYFECTVGVEFGALGKGTFSLEQQNELSKMLSGQVNHAVDLESRVWEMWWVKNGVADYSSKPERIVYTDLVIAQHEIFVMTAPNTKMKISRTDLSFEEHHSDSYIHRNVGSCEIKENPEVERVF